MVGDEPLKVHDGHWLVDLLPSAFPLTVISADSTAHAWEGICPFENFVSVIDAAGTDQGNVSRNVHAYGTGVLARALKQLGTNRGGAALVKDVSFVFMPEVPDGAQHRIRHGLAQAAKGCVFDPS
jgi:hypothetical protein